MYQKHVPQILDTLSKISQCKNLSKFWPVVTDNLSGRALIFYVQWKQMGWRYMEACGFIYLSLDGFSGINSWAGKEQERWIPSGKKRSSG